MSVAERIRALNESSAEKMDMKSNGTQKHEQVLRVVPITEAINTGCSTLPSTRPHLPPRLPSSRAMDYSNTSDEQSGTQSEQQLQLIPTRSPPKLPPRLLYIPSTETQSMERSKSLDATASNTPSSPLSRLKIRPTSSPPSPILLSPSTKRKHESRSSLRPAPYNRANTDNSRSLRVPLYDAAALPPIPDTLPAQSWSSGEKKGLLMPKRHKAGNLNITVWTASGDRKVTSQRLSVPRSGEPKPHIDPSGMAKGTVIPAKVSLKPEPPKVPMRILERRQAPADTNRLMSPTAEQQTRFALTAFQGATIAGSGSAR